MGGEGWQRVRLGSVCLVNPEARGRDWKYPQIEYIDISSVGTGRMVQPPSVLPFENAPSRAQRLVRNGDIIISTVRPNRRSFLYMKDVRPNTVVSTGFVVLRATDKIDSRFLYYIIATQQFTDYLDANTYGSAYPAVSPKVFEDAEVMIPPLKEQQAIAYILGALDDKIELNRRMSQTLEAMARAIFKSWFIDFDPVRAKAAGRQPPGVAPHIADLFPDSFEDSELGEIPRGWKIRPFSETVQIFGGGTPKTTVGEYWGGNIPWFSVVDAPADSDIFVIDTERKITQSGLENSAARLLPEGVTIISARGTVGKVALAGVPMAINQSCYGLLGMEAGQSFTYYATRHLVSLLKQHSHGSVFDTITRATLASVNVIVPTNAALKVFELLVDPILRRVKNNAFECRALASVRDSLLPKLISGELHIPDAERIVGRYV